MPQNLLPRPQVRVEDSFGPKKGFIFSAPTKICQTRCPSWNLEAVCVYFFFSFFFFGAGKTFLFATSRQGFEDLPQRNMRETCLFYLRQFAFSQDTLELTDFKRIFKPKTLKVEQNDVRRCHEKCDFCFFKTRASHFWSLREKTHGLEKKLLYFFNGSRRKIMTSKHKKLGQQQHPFFPQNAGKDRLFTCQSKTLAGKALPTFQVKS